MEYKLNKIDIELRQMVNDAAKVGKVHGSKGTSKISKDKKEKNKPKNKQQKKKDNKKLSEKTTKNTNEKILVDVEKTNEIEIDAFKEKEENSVHGRFLDTKR